MFFGLLYYTTHCGNKFKSWGGWSEKSGGGSGGGWMNDWMNGVSSVLKKTEVYA